MLKKRHNIKKTVINNLNNDIIDEVDTLLFSSYNLLHEYNLNDIFINQCYDDLTYFRQNYQLLWHNLLDIALSDDDISEIHWSFYFNDLVFDDEFFTEMINIEDILYYNDMYLYYSEFFGKVFKHQLWGYYKETSLDVFKPHYKLRSYPNKYFFNFNYLTLEYDDICEFKKTKNLQLFKLDSLLDVKAYYVLHKVILKNIDKKKEPKTPISVMSGEPFFPYAFMYFFILFFYFTLINQFGLRIYEGHANSSEWWYLSYYFLPQIEIFFNYFNYFNYSNLYEPTWENPINETDEADYIRFFLDFSYLFNKLRDPLFDYNNLYYLALNPVIPYSWLSDPFFPTLNNFLNDFLQYVLWFIEKDIFIKEISYIFYYKKFITILFFIYFLYNIRYFCKPGVPSINSNANYAYFVITNYKINKQKWINYKKKKNDIISKT